MFSSPDQFSNATKATFESQLAAMNDLANKALKSVSDLVELNVATVKSSLEHSPRQPKYVSQKLHVK